MSMKLTPEQLKEIKDFIGLTPNDENTEDTSITDKIKLPDVPNVNALLFSIKWAIITLVVMGVVYIIASTFIILVPIIVGFIAYTLYNKENNHANNNKST